MLYCSKDDCEDVFPNRAEVTTYWYGFHAQYPLAKHHCVEGLVFSLEPFPWSVQQPESGPE